MIVISYGMGSIAICIHFITCSAVSKFPLLGIGRTILVSGWIRLEHILEVIINNNELQLQLRLY